LDDCKAAKVITQLNQHRQKVPRFGQPIDGASLWLWRSEIQYLLQQLTPDAEPVATHETHATNFDGEFATGWLDSSFRLARAGWWCKAT